MSTAQHGAGQRHWSHLTVSISKKPVGHSHKDGKEGIKLGKNSSLDMQGRNEGHWQEVRVVLSSQRTCKEYEGKVGLQQEKRKANIKNYGGSE